MLESENRAHAPQPPTWRALCRAIAQERACAEDAAAWNQEPQQLPFAYRWQHVQQVVGLAQWLAPHVGADPEVIEAAAWLHDICKTMPNHAEEGAIEAGRILAESDFPPHKRETVVVAIRQHEGLFRPADAPPLEPIEAGVLWDADKLSKIGVQALVTSLSGHWMMGKTLAERRQHIEPFVRNVLSQTVRSMNTAPAQQMARSRYRAMVDALEAWKQEENECTFPANLC